jgi:hypothetical protein
MQPPAIPAPSTEVVVTLLVGPGHMPTIEASASIIHGSESTFARIEADTGVHGPERHAVRLVLIGRRAAVLEVLDELRRAVIAAPVPLLPEDEQR